MEGGKAGPELQLGGAVRHSGPRLCWCVFLTTWQSICVAVCGVMSEHILTNTQWGREALLATFFRGEAECLTDPRSRGTEERTNTLSPGPLSQDPMLLNIELTLHHPLLYFMLGHVFFPPSLRPFTDVLLQHFQSTETGARSHVYVSTNAVPVFGQEPDGLNEAIQSFVFVLSWIFSLLLETSSAGP